MSDLIDRQKVLNTLDFADNALTDEERTVEKYKELLTECIEALPSVENKGEWIPCREREPHGLSFVALDEFNNYPWVCNSLFTLKDEDGVKHFYDATGYEDTILQGDVKAFLRGKKTQTFGGMTIYVRPPEIVAWMPLPRWMDYKPEPYKAERGE